MKNTDRKSSLRNRKLALESLENRELLAVGFSNVVTDTIDPTTQIAFNIANARQWASDVNDYTPKAGDVLRARLDGYPDEIDYALTGSGNTFTLSGVNGLFALTRTIVTGGKDIWVISGLTANKTHILTNYNDGTGFGTGENDPADITLGTVPEVPAGLFVNPLTSNSLRAYWTIGSTEASNITYELQWQINGGDWSTYQSKAVGAGASTTLVEGLNSNTLYQVRIRACNAYGNSNWSYSSTAWTAPDTTQFIRQSGYIQASSTSITLSWTEVKGCSYIIEYTCDDEWNNTNNKYPGYGDGNIWGYESENPSDNKGDMQSDAYGGISGVIDLGGGYIGYFPEPGNNAGGYITKTVEAGSVTNGVVSVEITQYIRDNARYYFDIMTISESSGLNASTIDCIAVHAGPRAPTNFVTTSKTVDSITLIRTQPITARVGSGEPWGRDHAGYPTPEIQYRKYGDTQWIDNGASLNFTGLQSNTRYEFRTRAKNNGTWSDFGEGNANSYANMTNPDGGFFSDWVYYDDFTALDTPQNFRSTVSTFNSITLRWDPLAGAEKYTLQYKKTNEANWTNYVATTLNGADSTATVGGLDSNMLYEFQIRSENTGGTSAWTKIEANTLSISPTGFIASGNTITSISLKWNSVRNVTYTLEYKKSLDSAWLQHTDPGGKPIEFQGTGGQLDTTVANLNSNTTYNFRLTAKYATNSESITTNYSTKSLKATNLKAVMTLDTATVTWDFLDAGIAYKLEYKQANSTTWIIWNGDISRGTTTGCVIPGGGSVLIPNTTYDFRVTSTHNSGTPEWVQITASTRTLVPIISSLTATATTATLKWEDQSLLGVEGYTLEYQKTSDTGWTLYTASVLGPTTNEVTVTGLTSNTTYNFRLTARKSPAAPGVIADSVTTGAIIVFDSFVAEAQSGTEIKLLWNVSEGVQLTDFTGFKLECKEFDKEWTDTTTQVVTLTSDKLEYLFKDLKPDTRYNFRLTLLGSGEEVHSVDTRTFLPNPSGFTAERLGDTQVVLNWGGIPTDCQPELEYRIIGAATWTQLTVGEKDTTRTVNGLNIRTGYEFRIRNVRQSGVGNSGWEIQTVPAIVENAYEQNLIQTQRLTNYATWERIGDEMRLTAIRCPSRNLIGTLDLSQCTELKTVICNNNQLTALNLSGSTKVETVDCSNNLLTSLSITGLSNLSSLKCFYNLLTFLTLPQFTPPTGGEYAYYSGVLGQKEIVIGTNGEIPPSDFSGLQPLVNAAGGTTDYAWYDQNDNLVTEGITNTNGVFSFDDSLFGQQLYCVMTNTKFPGLKLVTTSVEVSGTADPTPSAPLNLKAEPLESRNVNLTWDAVPEATYYLVYWVLTDGSERLLGTTVDPEYTTARLPVGENTLRVYALAGSYKSDAAEVKTIVGTIGTPPAAPTNLQADPLASRNVNLTWDVVPEATSYQIYWVLADGSERLLRMTTDTKYTTARLPIGENTLRVYALADGLKSDAAEITTTVGTTVTPPSAPTNLQAEPLESRNVNLTWDTVPGAAAYQIYWVLADGSERLLRTMTDTKYTTARLPIGENTLRVYALAGNLKSDAAEVTTTVGTVTPPVAPKNLQAEALASRNANLAWDAVPGATSYQIYWVLADGSERLLGTTADTKYTTARLPVGENTLRVYTLVGNLKSVPAQVTTTIGTLAPTAPTNLEAESLASRNVNLTWTVAPGATLYQVYWVLADGSERILGITANTKYTTARLPIGENTLRVYALVGNLKSDAAEVTTTVGTVQSSLRTLSPLEIVFAEYDVME